MIPFFIFFSLICSVLGVFSEARAQDKPIYLEATGNESDDFNRFIKEQKGKVIYVDFYASWCKPCMEEMMYAKKHKSKQVTDGVTYLYISLDTKEEYWKRVIDWYELSGYHFKASPIGSGNQNSLTKKFKVNAIPRYLIIDKSGNIVEQDAPRPSQPKLLRKKLEKYLTK